MYIDRLNLHGKELEYVQIDGHAVDTYGTVELSSIELKSNPNYGEELASVFIKRPGTGNGIKPKGALDVLITLMSFEYYKSAEKTFEEINGISEDQIRNMTKEQGGTFMQRMNQAKKAWEAVLQLMNIAEPDMLRHRRSNAIDL